MPVSMDEIIRVDGKRFPNREQADAYARQVGKPVETTTRERLLAQGVNPDETAVVGELRQ